jgi:CBS domain-containing protein
MREQLIVKDWMSHPVLTVEPSMTIADAHSLMRERNVRRFPVTRHGKLIGIVTLGDIREASPSKATTLSIWELNYLWAQLTVERVMTHRVCTVSPDALLATAARVMLDHKISGLPVVESDRVVGIITESDLFRAIIASETTPA